MTTEDDVYALLQRYFSTINAEAAALDSAYPPLAIVIRDRQSQAPRPVGAYAMLTGQGFRDDGEALAICHDALTVATVPRVVESRVRSLLFLVRVDVYAPGASMYAGLFMNALKSDRAALDLSPLVVRRVKPTVSAPELIGQQWEGRAHFDVEIAALSTGRTLVDVIETVGIDFTGKGGGHDPVSIATQIQKVN